MNRDSLFATIKIVKDLLNINLNWLGMLLPTQSIALFSVITLTAKNLLKEKMPSKITKEFTLKRSPFNVLIMNADNTSQPNLVYAIISSSIRKSQKTRKK